MSNFRTLMTVTRQHIGTHGNDHRADVYQAALLANTKLTGWPMVIRVVDFCRYIDEIKERREEKAPFRLTIMCNGRYMTIPVRIEEEPNAVLFGQSIARDLNAKSMVWSVTLYRRDGTPVTRWHQNRPEGSSIGEIDTQVSMATLPVMSTGRTAPEAGGSLPGATEPTR